MYVYYVYYVRDLVAFISFCKIKTLESSKLWRHAGFMDPVYQSSGSAPCSVFLETASEVSIYLFIFFVVILIYFAICFWSLATCRVD